MEDPGYSQAGRALAYGADVVLAGGGDGTVRVVAEKLAATDVPMGLVPLGTGNLLARNLDMDVNDLEPTSTPRCTATSGTSTRPPWPSRIRGPGDSRSTRSW